MPPRNRAPSRDDVIVFGNDYVQTAGETVTGSVVVSGGIAAIEAGAVVTRDVVVFGDIELGGTVNGSVIGSAAMFTHRGRWR